VPAEEFSRYVEAELGLMLLWRAGDRLAAGPTTSAMLGPAIDLGLARGAAK